METCIRISDLINKPGFIQETTGTPTAAHYEHTTPGILIVYYPEYEQDVVLRIPQNLQDLGNDLVQDWGPIDDKTFVDDLDVYLNYTYYVRLKRQRAPDLFTAFELKKTKDENRQMKALDLPENFYMGRNPYRAYFPPISWRQRFSDAVGCTPDSSRNLPKELVDIIGSHLKDKILTDRNERRYNYLGSSVTAKADALSGKRRTW